MKELAKLLLLVLMLQIVPVRLLVIPAVDTLRVGQTRSYCIYFQFSNGHVAMRARDAQRCGADFTTRYKAWRRYVSRARQQWVDTRCFALKLSDTTVARATQETCRL